MQIILIIKSAAFASLLVQEDTQNFLVSPFYRMQK